MIINILYYIIYVFIHLLVYQRQTAITNLIQWLRYYEKLITEIAKLW